MDLKVIRGAEIIINDWLNLKPYNKLLIVTEENHLSEVETLRDAAGKIPCIADIMVADKVGIKVGVYFDENKNAFDGYDFIIGACQHSLVTTGATKKAIKRGGNFLSLPLATNNGLSMLCFDFIKTMDTKLTLIRANIIMSYIKISSVINVSTKKGTNLEFGMKGRKPGFFNGNVKDGKGYSSASMEIYIPIEETKTQGVFILDGSFGYIGKVENPVKILFSDGKITYIEDSADGKKLKNYIELFNDNNMYIAAEFGIGLNSKSKCRGNCYIEDESAYGTFHIGFGRNLALGGILEAKGHFDLVAHKPDIFFDNKIIMEQGKIVIPEFLF